MCKPSSCACCAGCIQELSLIGTQPHQYWMLTVVIQLDPAIFCNLKRVWLKSNLHSVLEIHVPAVVHLDSLQIHADALGLEFEDAMVSCGNLTNVNVFVRQSLSPPLAELLCASLARNGVYNCLYTQNESTLLMSMPPPDGYKRAMARHLLALEIFRDMDHKCSCSICWECVRR